MRPMKPARFAVGCALAALFASLTSGCDKPGSRISTYPVLVHAFDDTGKPLAGVQLTAAGRAIGATEANGDKLFSLNGMEGDRLDFAGTCPESYKGPRTQPILLLKQVQSLQAQGLQPIELNLVCDAKDHLMLVAIRTGRAGLPVQLRGQPVAVTSATGTAHVYLKEPIGNSFQLTLDTRAADSLRPASPSRQFAVGERDDFTVWDQPFEETKKPPPVKIRKYSKRKPEEPGPPPPAPPPPKHIPERL